MLHHKNALQSDKASDMEVACFLIRCIDASPDIRITGIMEFAIRELEKMSNPFAIQMLREKINEE
jgi:hypothetical protein